MFCMSKFTIYMYNILYIRFVLNTLSEKNCYFWKVAYVSSWPTFAGLHHQETCPCNEYPLKKVQVGKDQEKAQPEKRFPLQKPRWVKTKLTIRYLYYKNIS